MKHNIAKILHDKVNDYMAIADYHTLFLQFQIKSNRSILQAYHSMRKWKLYHLGIQIELNKIGNKFILSISFELDNINIHYVKYF